MSAGNRVHNIFINSANRNIQDSAYDFTIDFIIIKINGKLMSIVIVEK